MAVVGSNPTGGCEKTASGWHSVAAEFRFPVRKTSSVDAD